MSRISYSSGWTFKKTPPPRFVNEYRSNPTFSKKVIKPRTENQKNHWRPLTRGQIYESLCKWHGTPLPPLPPQHSQHLENSTCDRCKKKNSYIKW